MLKRLRLENWKSHQSTELDFGQGPNVLVGIMGSGKTSVVEAISFALFGTFPSLQSKKIALDDLIATGQNAGKAELQFESAGKTYTVVRDLRRGKGSSAEVSEDGTVLEVNPRNVTETVTRLLGMDYDLFSKAVYSEQNGMDYFLRIPRGQRMGHIDRMLRLDRYEKAREGCVALKNKVKAGASGILKVIADMEKERPEEALSAVQGSVVTLSGDINAMKADATRLDGEKRGLETQLQKAEASVKAADDARRRLDRISATVDEMKVSLHGLHERVGKGEAADIALLRKDLEKTEAILEKKKEASNILRENVASVNATLRQLKEKDIPELHRRHMDVESAEKGMKRIDAEFRDIENTLPQTKARLEGLQTEIGRLESTRDEIGKYLGVVDGGRCPACGQNVTDDMRNALEAARKEEFSSVSNGLDERRGAMQALRKSVASMESAWSERSTLAAKAKERDFIIQQLLDVENAVKATADSGKSLANELKKSAEAVASAEATVKSAAATVRHAESLLADLNMFHAMQQRMSTAMEEAAATTKELAWLESATAGIDINVLRSSLSSSISASAALLARLSGSIVMFHEKEKLSDELRKRVETLTRYREETAENEAAVDMLSRLETVLSATQQQLREEFVKSVNNIMNALWPDLYPYGDFSEVRLGIDDDYVLQLRHGDEWFSADGAASGGERSLACLALRIAFSLAFMPNLRWLILDEPTHNLDANAVEKLAEILRERSHLFAEQVFVITHDERLSEGLHSIRLERDKAAGSSTRLAA